ncbi:MAG: divergent polysaccharide deacetylase family protein [candidate division KSB1 bacterium]|nr:divergent polysaccharide deacetylase family protein [candidate division KSB1 bacterium]
MKRQTRNISGTQSKKQQSSWVNLCKHISQFHKNTNWPPLFKWLLIVTLLNIVFAFFIAPRIHIKQTSELSSKEVESIRKQARESLLNQDLLAMPDTAEDTLVHLEAPLSTSIYNIYQTLNQDLRSVNATILKGKKLGPTLYQLKIGKQGRAVQTCQLHLTGGPSKDNPRIALIIDDFGYTMSNAALAFLKLDAAITVSVIPGLNSSSKAADVANLYEKEVLVHMPMEPKNAEFDLTPFTLTTDMQAGEISMRIKTALAELPTAVGMNNHMGSKATENEKVMQTILLTLKSRNKFWIDSRTSQKSIAYALARELGVPSAQNNIFLDARETDEFIRNQLLLAGRMARKNGSAIAIGHVKMQTFDAIKDIIPKLQETGIQFVSVSKLVH